MWTFTQNVETQHREVMTQLPTQSIRGKQNSITSAMIQYSSIKFTSFSWAFLQGSWMVMPVRKLLLRIQFFTIFLLPISYCSLLYCFTWTYQLLALLITIFRPFHTWSSELANNRCQIANGHKIRAENYQKEQKDKKEERRRKMTKEEEETKEE